MKKGNTYHDRIELIDIRLCHEYSMMNKQKENKSGFLAKLLKVKSILYRLRFLISVLRYKGYRELLTLKLDKRYPVIDLGANIGQSSIILWFRGFEVYAYEPHPIAFKKLKKLFKNVKIIHTMNAAIVENKDSSVEEKRLFLHKDQNKGNQDLSQGSSLMNDKTNINNSTYYKVKSYKIDEIIEKFEKISLLKCDIEGYEYVLYKDLLLHKHKIKYFIIETHANKNPQWKKEDIELKAAFSKQLPKNKYDLNWH